MPAQTEAQVGLVSQGSRGQIGGQVAEDIHADDMGAPAAGVSFQAAAWTNAPDPLMTGPKSASGTPFARWRSDRGEDIPPMEGTADLRQEVVFVRQVDDLDRPAVPFRS